MFGLIRADLLAFRQEVNGRLDKLVTQDAFDGERRRVDGLIQGMAKDVADERDARKEADAAEKAARIAEVDILAKKSANTGLWIRWGVGLVIGIPSAWFAFAQLIAATAAK